MQLFSQGLVPLGYWMVTVVTLAGMSSTVRSMGTSPRPASKAGNGPTLI